MRRGSLSLLGKAMISIDRVGKWRCLGTARASSSGRKSSSQVPSLVRYIPKECRKPGEESLQSVQFPGRICSSSSIEDNDDEELGFEDGSFARTTKKRTSRFYYDDTEKQRSQLGLASLRKAFGSKEGGSNFSARLDEEQDEEEDDEEEEDRNGMKLEEDSSEEEDESLEADARHSGRTDHSAVTCSETTFRSQEELSSSDEEADEMVESAASRTTLEQDVFSRLQLVPASKLVSKPKPERKRGRFPAAGSISTKTLLDTDDDADDASSKLASLGLVSLRDASSLDDVDESDELEDEDVVDAAFALEVERKKKTETEIFPDSSGERSAARNYAIFLLGKWQRTAMELRKKLAEKNYSPQVIESTISALLEEGLQSDASYADVFAQSRWNTRGWGPKRIRYELVRKGVAAANIDRALQRAFQADKDGNITQESEEMRWGMSKQAEEHILALAARKWSTGGNVSVETRSRRLAGWLQQRGFGWKVVNGIVKTLERNNSQPKL